MRDLLATPDSGGASWICCQHGAREHYAVPRALKRLGVDVRMITDLWWRPSKGSRFRLSPTLQGRFHPDFSAGEVMDFSYRSIVRRLVQRLRRPEWYREQEEINEAFQRHCLSALKKIPDDASPRVVFAYSYAASEILSYARERGWKTVLGQIDPGPLESRIVIREYERLGFPPSRFYLPPDGYWDRWRSETELADHIAVNSEWSAACLKEEHVAAEKIHVVPCAYEAAPQTASFKRVYPDAFSNDRPMKVLFLGQPVVRKGIHLVIEAAEKMLGLPVRFTIVGGNTDLPDLRLPDNVEWVGQIPRQETANHYRSADVFLLPTLSDGFALTQLEALSWKLPVLVSRHCGEVITDGVNGILLEVVSADAIRSRLSDLLSTPDALQRMSDAPDVLGGFGLEAVGRRLLDLTRSPQRLPR